MPFVILVMFICLALGVSIVPLEAHKFIMDYGLTYVAQIIVVVALVTLSAIGTGNDG